MSDAPSIDEQIHAIHSVIVDRTAWLERQEWIEALTEKERATKKVTLNPYASIARLELPVLEAAKATLERVKGQAAE